MIITTETRNAAANAFDDTVNGGTAAGKLIFETVADADLVPVTLNNPAFSAAATGTISLDTAPAVSGTATASGTVAQASFFTTETTPVKVAELTVGTGAQEITISNTTIAISDVIQITSLDITMPAS